MKTLDNDVFCDHVHTEHETLRYKIYAYSIKQSGRPTENSRQPQQFS